LEAQAQAEMLRQKQYHDRKLNWEDYKNGDLVYVSFPRHKSGLSPKLTSCRHGRFKIITKCSNINYKVDCGPRGIPQVNHVDRMSFVRFQLISGERENLPDVYADSSAQ
jgi:hypothetical protein